MVIYHHFIVYNKNLIFFKNFVIILLRIKYTNNTYEKVYNQIINFIKENFDGLITRN